MIHFPYFFPDVSTYLHVACRLLNTSTLFKAIDIITVLCVKFTFHTLFRKIISASNFSGSVERCVLAGLHKSNLFTVMVWITLSKKTLLQGKQEFMNVMIKCFHWCCTDICCKCCGSAPAVNKFGRFTMWHMLQHSYKDARVLSYTWLGRNHLKIFANFVNAKLVIILLANLSLY